MRLAGTWSHTQCQFRTMKILFHRCVFRKGNNAMLSSASLPRQILECEFTVSVLQKSCQEKSGIEGNGWMSTESGAYRPTFVQDI